MTPRHATDRHYLAVVSAEIHRLALELRTARSEARTCSSTPALRLSLVRGELARHQ